MHIPPGGVAPVPRPRSTPRELGALVRAMERAFGTEVLLLHARAAAARRPTSSSVLGAPLVFLGAGLPDDRIHSPNERVLLPMLHRGAEAAAYLWRELASLGPHRRST